MIAASDSEKCAQRLPGFHRNGQADFDMGAATTTCRWFVLVAVVVR